jgi:hypothetical protein
MRRPVRDGRAGPGERPQRLPAHISKVWWRACPTHRMHRGDFELGHGVFAVEQPGGHGQEALDFAVDDDGVQPFFAAEMFVNDWL